jgi:hypothetical protein
MTTQAKPLSAGALDEYIREIVDTAIDASADATALATAIQAFDEGAAQVYRMRQVQEGLGQVRGRNLTYGQVASIAITTPGTAYEVGDKFVVTTSTGTGFSGHVSAVDGSGAILGVEIDVAGTGYDEADTATVITSTAGNSGELTATVGKNEMALIDGAFAILIP